ncbi:hypothetical protein [Candidatus Electronema sp. PJ]|uniref:hypothetical protein n=1 Tax=Candidatus Electronema sp. PJ TaxID=3401572 RepID=UPI003AA81D06
MSNQILVFLFGGLLIALGLFAGKLHFSGLTRLALVLLGLTSLVLSLLLDPQIRALLLHKGAEHQTEQLEVRGQLGKECGDKATAAQCKPQEFTPTKVDPQECPKQLDGTTQVIETNGLCNQQQSSAGQKSPCKQ